MGSDTATGDTQVGLYSGSPSPDDSNLISTLNGSIGGTMLNYEFTPGATVNLLADTTYWVQVKTTKINTSVNWGYTNTQDGVGPGYLKNSGSYNIGTNEWSFTAEQPLFIEVQAVPEPGTFLMGIFATSGVAGGCWIRRKRKNEGFND